MATNTDQLFDDRLGFGGWLVVLAILGVVLWKVWPQLKANNIFMKKTVYPQYAQSESAKKKRMFYTPPEAILFCVLLNLGDVLVFVCSKKIPAIGRFIGYFPPGGLMGLSLVCFIATFIYDLINEPDFSDMRDFRFAARVWLTTIFMVPAILLALNPDTIGGYRNFIYALIFFAGGAHGVGIVVFATLILAVNHFSCKSWKIRRKKLYILAWCQLALLVSFLLITIIFGHIANSIWMWLVFAFVLTGSILFYKMTPIIYSDESDHPAEVLDE